MKEGFKRLWKWLKRAWAALTARKYSTIAGSLVFFLIMSLVPFLLWLVILFGQSGLHIDEILELDLFDWAKDLLVFFKENAADAASGVSVLFLLTTLWSSTGFFYHLRRSGEILYDYRRQKHGWKVRIAAVLLTFGVLIFFAGAGTLLLWVERVARRFPLWVYYLIVYNLMFILGFFTAGVLNFYICPYRCRLRDILIGSILTALAWLLASGAFALYLNFANQERLYGALSLIIVFFLWLYWMMICFTSGVIFNRHRMKVRGLEHKTL